MQPGILLGEGAEARDIDHEGNLPGQLVEVHRRAVDVFHGLPGEYAHPRRGCGIRTRIL